MTALEKIRKWLSTFPGNDRLRSLRVDYFSADPDNGNISPSGLVEISRTEDILGNVIVRNQYNFALYYVLTKAPGDDEGATENADWLMEFQEWIQKQSILGLAPTFGDEPKTEQITAQNGTIYGADEGGTANYMVQLSATFKKYYEII